MTFMMASGDFDQLSAAHSAILITLFTVELPCS